MSILDIKRTSISSFEASFSFIEVLFYHAMLGRKMGEQREYAGKIIRALYVVQHFQTRIEELKAEKENLRIILRMAIQRNNMSREQRNELRPEGRLRNKRTITCNKILEVLNREITAHQQTEHRLQLCVSDAVRSRQN